MKKTILIILSIIFFSSCGNIAKRRFIKTYNYAIENPDLNSRVGYKGKPCTIVTNQSIDCILILETYEEFKFIQKYRFSLKTGLKFKATIQPDQYFLVIEIEGKRYDNFVFNSYLPSWTVNLNNWINEAKNQHEESILLAKKTK